MIRTAIVGLGKVAADIHLPACANIEDVQVVAGCDPVDERRMMMKERFSLPRVYADLQLLLEKEKPNLVVIGTPPHLHKELALQALEHGAHVLCEKPFVCSIDEADELITAAKRNRRLLAVNNQYRYMNIYSQVQEQLARGVYGRPFFLQCWQQMFHPPALDETGWRRQLEHATLFEFGTHPLDLICYFFDAFPTAVNAVIPKPLADYQADVLVQMTLYFPEDRLATLIFNRVSHAPERYLEMRLDCEEGSLRISLGGVARASFSMNRYRGRSRPSFRLSVVKGGEARAEVGGRSTMIAKERRSAFATATVRHLRSLLPEMQEAEPSLTHALRAQDILRIVFAGYESARTRRIVDLNDVSTVSFSS